MSLNYEMAKYTELTGEDGTKVPISRLGGFLDGYEKGRADAIEELSIKCITHIQEAKPLTIEEIIHIIHFETDQMKGE